MTTTLTQVAKFANGTKVRRFDSHRKRFEDQNIWTVTGHQIVNHRVLYQISCGTYPRDWTERRYEFGLREHA